MKSNNDNSNDDKEWLTDEEILLNSKLAENNTSYDQSFFDENII